MILRNVKRIFCFVGMLFLLLTVIETAHAAILKNEKGIGWLSSRDLTSRQFKAKYENYKKRGYLMVDIDAYPVGNGVRYAMIWRRNTDNRKWAENRDMSSNGYNEKWENYRGRGYRPHDVETYHSGNSRKWAGIWVENKEKLSWTSKRGLSGSQYGQLFKEKSKAGFRLIDVEVYSTRNGLRYACIWLENKDRTDWAQLRNMTRSQYQKEVDKRSAKGFQVVDYESYLTSEGQRYAAIWERKPGYAWHTRTNRTKIQFANLWRQYRDEGFRLIDFECYQTPQGARYAGIWAENDSRYRYNRKALINTAIENYKNINALPGISVAIVRNGQMIYQRGVGFADVAANKVAHGRTVYTAASVSKVIGGTLAAKLEAEGRLRNGARFRLDLTRPTADFLTNIAGNSGRRVSLPDFHTHTVEQLLAHLGCVAHYRGRTEPGIADSGRHYSTASAAARAIWDTGLVTDTNAETNTDTACTVGQTRSYSTGAFTLIGAVLEQVTGRNVTRLVHDEIADPYNLSSLRVMYAAANLAVDYDRAAHYGSRDAIHSVTEDWVDPPNMTTNPNTLIGFKNNSWKVFGGGIEVSTVDLVRFGWLVLNGNVVTADVRDNRLWTPVRRMLTNGLAWELRSIDQRRVAEHGGSATGARSHLRIYRDENLVIAIMSNRRNHRRDLRQDLPNLTTEIANIVLR